MNEKIKVLIADDHPILAIGLKMTLEQWEEFTVVGIAANGQETLELCERDAPDIVIMDMRMPLVSGRDAILAIKQTRPEIKILAFTTFDDSQTVSQAIEAGCDGFLLKVIEPEKLRTALLSIMDGINIYDEGAMQSLRQSMAAKEKIKVEFGDREQMVLRCICKGMTNAEIAAQMGLRPGTVKNMVSLLLSKTSCISRSQLARYATEQGLIGEE